MAIEIQQPGFHSVIKRAVEDEVMDLQSAVTANLLIGNARNERVIEMNVFGVSMQFEEDCIIAVTGSQIKPALNGFVFEMNRAITVQAGDELICGFCEGGMRSYLAVSGGFTGWILREDQRIFSNERKLLKKDKIWISAGKTLRNLEQRSVLESDYKTDGKIGVALDKELSRSLRKQLYSAFSAPAVIAAADLSGYLFNTAVSIPQKDWVENEGYFGELCVNQENHLAVNLQFEPQRNWCRIGEIVSADMGILVQKRRGDAVLFHVISFLQEDVLERKRDKRLDAIERKLK